MELATVRVGHARTLPGRPEMIILALDTAGLDEMIEFFERTNIESQLGRSIGKILPELDRTATVATPVVTGSMARAWISTRQGIVGEMGIDPMAVNPRSGVRVATYAPFVSDRLCIMEKVEAVSRRVCAAGLEEIKLGHK